MPEAVAGVPALDILKASIGIAKDLTLTSFLLWVLVMMMTGRLVRREELNTAIANTRECNDNIIKADAKADWWRDKYLAQEDNTRQILTTQGATIAALKATLDAMITRQG